ncbi:MAG: 4-hydroxy-tetrahydrodipicolinate synthase, partial [Dinoroseobacter sp.]
MDGIIAAVPTPVDGAHMPLRELFVDHCQWALANGCDGLNILGSTGEANSFDTATRRAVMGWAAEACPTER